MHLFTWNYLTLCITPVKLAPLAFPLTLFFCLMFHLSLWRPAGTHMHKPIPLVDLPTLSIGSFPLWNSTEAPVIGARDLLWVESPDIHAGTQVLPLNKNIFLAVYSHIQPPFLNLFWLSELAAFTAAVTRWLRTNLLLLVTPELWPPNNMSSLAQASTATASIFPLSAFSCFGCMTVFLNIYILCKFYQ